MTSCFVCATLNLGRKKSTGTEPNVVVLLYPHCYCIMVITTEGDNIRDDNVAVLLHVHLHCYCIMVISTKGDNIRDVNVNVLLYPHCYCNMGISTEGDTIRDDNVNVLLYPHCYFNMGISTEGDNIRDDNVAVLLHPDRYWRISVGRGDVRIPRSDRHTDKRVGYCTMGYNLLSRYTVIIKMKSFILL